MNQFNIVRVVLWACTFFAALCTFPSLFVAAETDTGVEGYGIVIGIDLGTTFSCVAVWQDGQVEVRQDCNLANNIDYLE